MRNKTSLIIAVLVLSSGILNQEQNCKVPYNEEEESTGCRECIDGPYYKKEATPEGAPKKNYSCFKCPENSTKCKYEEIAKKVAIETCEAKFYIEKKEGATDDACSACPAMALSCTKENNIVMISECETKYFVLPKDGSNDECKSCPSNSKKCNFDKTTKKIII